MLAEDGLAYTGFRAPSSSSTNPRRSLTGGGAHASSPPGALSEDVIVVESDDEGAPSSSAGAGRRLNSEFLPSTTCIHEDPEHSQERAPDLFPLHHRALNEVTPPLFPLYLFTLLLSLHFLGGEPEMLYKTTIRRPSFAQALTLSPSRPEWRLYLVFPLDAPLYLTRPLGRSTSPLWALGAQSSHLTGRRL